MNAPIIGIERHRIVTDGKGITTLVAFHGCPLHCKYCLNPQCHDPNLGNKKITPEELYEKVSTDNLYFTATGGGITFGGGEPLLQSAFIRRFCEFAPKAWNISVETSLNVDCRHLEEILPVVDNFYVDIKDINPTIYKAYTQHDNNKVIENLKLLASLTPKENVIIRMPLIPHFNNDTLRTAGINELKKYGFINFDLFNYITNER